MELNPSAMDEPPKLKPSRTIRIGPDHVTITDQEVFIEARHELPDWQVRQFKVIAIYFEDKKYFLAEKRRGQPPYAICYVLSPWPESHIESATFFYTYDVQAVAERDESHRNGQRDELMRISLLPLYPFLGFLWSGAQRKLIRFGFAPQSITATSIFTGFSLILLQGAFTAVMINVSARAGNLMLGGMIRVFAGQDHFHFGPISIPVALLDSLLLLAFLADVPVRYSKHLREEEWAGGFLEWMMPQSRRRS